MLKLLICLVFNISCEFHALERVKFVVFKYLFEIR